MIKMILSLNRRRLNLLCVSSSSLSEVTASANLSHLLWIDCDLNVISALRGSNREAAIFSIKIIFESFLQVDSQKFEKPASVVSWYYNEFDSTLNILQWRQFLFVIISSWIEASLNRDQFAIIFCRKKSEKLKRKCLKLQNYSKNANHKSCYFLDSTWRMLPMNAQCIASRRRQKNDRQHAELCT